MCGQRGIRPLGPVPTTHPGKFHTAKFALVYCDGCDGVYLSPTPTQLDLKQLYEDSVQFSDAHYTDPIQVEKILEYYTTSMRNLKLLPASGESVLEIGAGLAWVSRACKALEPGVVTVAQDVSAECASHCAWVDSYVVGTIDAIPDQPVFKLASMTHVIEHLIEPKDMLNRIARRLLPGGKLFVTAPFRPVNWDPQQGIKPWLEYSYLHVPAHISYLSRTWFAKHAPAVGLEVAHWDATSEDGQAFELVLIKAA